MADPVSAVLGLQQPCQQVGGSARAGATDRRADVARLERAQDGLGFAVTDQSRMGIAPDLPFLARPALSPSAVAVSIEFVMAVPYGVASVGERVPLHTDQ